MARLEKGNPLITCARLAACAVLACAAMLLAACGSSPEPAGSRGATSSPPVSRAPATAAASSPSPAGSTAPAAPATPGVAGTWIGYGPCPNLEVKLGLSEHDPAVTYQVIDFTNRGSVSCVLSGYPGVSLAAGSPALPIGLPAAHTAFAVPARVLTLQPGGVANATLEIADAHHYGQGMCGPVQTQYLIVYRPNQANPVKLSYTATACSKPVRLLQVSAVSFGTGG